MTATYTLPPQSAVLDAFLDERQSVRDAALRWFENVWTPMGDADMFEASRRIVAAIEKYGPETFAYPAKIAGLPWAPETLDRLIEPAFEERLHESDLHDALTDIALLMPVALYRECGANFVEACKRNDALSKAIRRRFKAFDDAASETPAQWWERALAWCASQNAGRRGNIDKLFALIDLLAHHGGEFVDAALAILADPSTTGSWEETFAIDYLAKLGEPRAVEPIVARLLAPEEGNENTVGAVAERFGRFPAGLVVQELRKYPIERLLERSVATSVNCLRSEDAVRLAMEMAAACEDSYEAASAIDSALDNLALELVPAAVAFLEKPDVDLEMDVLERLEMLAAFHGLEVPQLLGLRAELEKREAAELQRWRSMYPGFGAPLSARPILTPAFDEPFPTEEWRQKEWEPEAPPIAARNNYEVTMPLRREATVGRNEPCPCGSGKKYKKCCLATQASK